ncbi:hypothetical protein WN944_012425 [Citrus x changshan-huyou]|uniref:Uncharacterized protein n=1 Tax=Citrus x changshan-huyou TaxID=2935761 RepID=A0AAP0QZL5_9ROSI
MGLDLVVRRFSNDAASCDWPLQNLIWSNSIGYNFIASLPFELPYEIRKYVQSSDLHFSISSPIRARTNHDASWTLVSRSQTFKQLHVSGMSMASFGTWGPDNINSIHQSPDTSMAHVSSS